MAAKLPAIITPTLLHSIRDQSHLPRHIWYAVASVTLSAINRPDEIATVFKHALEQCSLNNPADAEPESAILAEQLRVARRLRESLLKAAAVTGMPKTINSVLALKNATPDALLDEPNTGSSPSRRAEEVYGTPASQILERGQTFFDHTYGKVSKRIMGQMDRSGTEDLGIVARLMYGYLLSNTSILSAAESSFVVIAALIPQDVNPQLKGHLRGALNNGATVEEVRAVRDAVLKICEAAGMTRLQDDSTSGGWGWREDVANV